MVGVAGLEGISFCCPHSPVPTAFSRPRSTEESGQENRNGWGRRARRHFILLSPFSCPNRLFSPKVERRVWTGE